VKTGSALRHHNWSVLLPLSGTLAQQEAAIAPLHPSWVSVFLFFLKIGCVPYGSGMCCWHFATRSRRAQPVADITAAFRCSSDRAVDTRTVFTTATFIGYLLAGNAGRSPGQSASFASIFARLFVNPLVPKLRQSSWASGFLDGVNAASLGLMAGVTYTLADCSSRLVDSRSGNFERDRGFSLRLTLPG